MTAAISVQDVTVHYGEVLALDRATLDVAPGRVCALIGMNGSGKSTLFKTLMGLVRPDSGTVRVTGQSPAQARRSGAVGYVPQSEDVDWSFPLSVRDVVMTGRYGHMGFTRRPRAADHDAVEHALARVELTGLASRQIGQLSGGQRKRAFVARGIAQGARILLLDDPTTGLDPQARHILWDRLFRLKEQGVTLVITTHFMDEAEQLCDRLVVIDHGKIVAEGSPQALIREYSTREVVEVRFGSARNAAMEAELRGMAERIEVLPDRILLYARDGEGLLEQISRRGLNPLTSLVRRSSLEDVFLRLTGRSLID